MSLAGLRRWGVQVAMALPLALLAWRWAGLLQGGDARALGLSAEPVDYTINHLGLWALRSLLLTLSITPLRRMTGWSWLAAWRRPLGLWCFTYASLHLLVYFGLDQLGSVMALAKDVAKHKFILLGFAGWCLLLPLAITSTRGMVRRLGARRWQRLHRLAYTTAVLVSVHFILRVKGFQPAPYVYAGVLAVLLALRVLARFRDKSGQRARAGNPLH